MECKDVMLVVEVWCAISNRLLKKKPTTVVVKENMSMFYSLSCDLVFGVKV